MESVESNLSGIYSIVNLKNNKRYIGSAKNLRIRRKSHFNRLRKGNHDNKHLQKSFDLYGEEFFDFIILETCDIKDLIAREQCYIDELKPEYNIRKIAKNNSGLKHSEESKEKIRKSKIGNKNGFKKGQRPKNIKTGKDNYFYGIRKFGSENPFFGKHHSDESIDKIKDKNNGKSRNKGENNPNKKLSDNQVIEIRKNKSLSTKELSFKYNVSEGQIRKIKRGEQRNK